MKQNYLIGIGFKILNCLMFTVMSLVMVKSASTVATMQVLFAQVFLGAIISFAYLKVIKQPVAFSMPRKEFLLYLARAVVNFVAVSLWIYALQTLGINEATALGYTGPFWVFIMAQYFIGERFSAKILALLFVNIAGVIIIVHPKIMNMHWHGMAAALCSILLWSLYEVICKKQTATQHYMLQTFYFMAISSLVMAPFAFNAWQVVSLPEVSMLVLIALLAVTNITIIFIAYSFAPLTVLAPFSYSRLLFTTFLTNWLYNISSTNDLFIGSAIIFIANGYVIYLSSKKRKEIYT